MKKLCEVTDLIKNSGVAALLERNGEHQQVAIFYLPTTEQKLFAIGNWDPCGSANVLSRGVVGSINDELVVASPLYKQHFSLTSGKCLEEDDKSVPTFVVEIKNDEVYIQA